MKTTIAIDPDSKAHGIAIFENKKLVDLKSLHLTQVCQLVKNLVKDDKEIVNICIEDVACQSFLYNRNSDLKDARSEIALSHLKGANLGKCQQSQIELIRALEFCFSKNININYIKPFGATALGKAKNKDMFKQYSSWEQSSNEDQRSAFFIGKKFLKIKKIVLPKSKPQTKSKLFNN